MRRLAAVFAFLAIIGCGVTIALGQTGAGASPSLSDFQKETIASIREVTLQLLLLAVGVVALMGGFAADKDKTFRLRSIGWIAFLAFGVSVVFGLLVYGNLIHALGKSEFDPFGEITSLATVQWVSFGLGGLLFMVFVLLNMQKRS